MILGFSPFTWFHTLLSLVALVAGAVVIAGLLRRQIERGWTAVYLTTSLATSLTGFGFPFDRFLPSHWVGVISLAALAVACVAYYRFALAGGWRWAYSISVIVSVYFLFFVLVAQIFSKVPAARALAPTQAEPPFAVAQLVLLVAFVVTGWVAARRFRQAA